MQRTIAVTLVSLSMGLPLVVRAVSACMMCFFFQAEDGIRDLTVTGVQTCALPICRNRSQRYPGTNRFCPAERYALHCARANCHSANEPGNTDADSDWFPAGHYPAARNPAAHYAATFYFGGSGIKCSADFQHFPMVGKR